MKNIIIYNKNQKINKNNHLNFIHYTNENLYDLYDARFMNPSFFDNIDIVRDDLSIDDLKMIYNMTKTNGTITFPKKYNFFFKKSEKIIKKDNLVYQFQKTRVVDFIIMGTQKGGTSALAINISKHPDIYIDNNPDPTKSEIHFFDINWKKGLEWYKRHFNYSKKMVGEKTPELMYLDYTFPLIQSINPYVKIILILRNPIERAYSAWKHAANYGETRSFEDSINDEIENIKNKLDKNKTFFTSITQYLQRGLYYKQIINILKWFSKDNLLILINEEVLKDMTTEYNKVYSFLNLKDFNGDYTLEYVSNNKTYMNNETYNNLINFFKKDVKLLEKMIGRKTGWLSTKL
jgi:hypothetical protein